ncbi:putative coiled-coil domain-containing protein 196 isoform X6 [Mustela lutreola]|uniref:Coiled-coil domain-containing protein 196 isoform X6 n=1 Tax=Mustela putorius furo TaxID=9669 RepID=A0A8U0RL27_MUSPF|nr:putative coiled-coil domain-containing protein 196 isoform X6 [Mustela putorius furo]XP_059035684.1 putative coiled-coil domain-containing protein 196 isoform X6 [Mustela lutreola]
MTSGSNPSGSYLPSKPRCSKIDENYLKELNEDLKLRKQELLEMLKPLEDKNNLLCQKLMSNLEEKQRSLQIMRQIMAGKGSEESSVMELIKEAEEMKQNLVPKTPSSSRKTKNELETTCAEKVKEKRKEKQQRKMEWVRYQEQANILQNDFNGKVIELRIEALKNYQKANDLKLSLYLQQYLEPKQAYFNLPGSRDTISTTTMDRTSTSKNESNVRILGSKTSTEQQGTRGSQLDDVGGRLLYLRSLPDEALKD